MLAAGLTLVFFLPYLLPATGEISDAYMAGYSTRAAMLLAIGVAFGFAVWTGGAGLRLPAREAGGPELSRGLLWATLAATALLAGLVWVGLRVAGPVNEVNYFADRLLMEQSGARVYRDFEFAYGPMMFFLSAAIRAVTGLSWGDSYLAGWGLQWLAGVAVLWKTVQLATEGTRAGRTIYLLLWGFFLTFVPDGATNFTPLRFASGLLLGLLVQRLLVRPGSAGPAFALAAVGFTALMCYSPEQAIGFGAASVVFFAFAGSWGRQGFAAGAGLLLAVVAAMTAAAARLGWLNGMRAFGEGGLAFPFGFSLVNVFLLLLLVAATCGVWGSWRAGDRQHGLLYLFLISGASVPAAFGRSDPGHVVLSLLGALMVGMVVLRPRRWLSRVATVGFAAFLLVWAGLQFYGDRSLLVDSMKAEMQASGCAGCRVERAYVSVWGRVVGPAKMAERMAWFQQRARPLPTGVKLLAPFGVQHRSFDASRENAALTGYYAGLLPLMSVGQVAAKMRELGAQPEAELLIPDGPLACSYDLVAERRAIRLATLALFTPPLRRNSTVAEPFCEYVRAHYRPTGEEFAPDHVSLWVPLGR